MRLPADDLFPYGARDLVGSRSPAPTWCRGPASSRRSPRPFRIASAALPEFPVVLRYGGEDDGVVDVHLTDAVTTTTALNLGALLGAAIVQLHAEGWTTRWEPVAHRRRHLPRRAAVAGHPARLTACRSIASAPVEIRELAVPDSYALDLVPHGDSRGRFTEWYRADVLAKETGFGLTLAQANHSVSARGVLRGVHFALVPARPGEVRLLPRREGARRDRRHPGRLADVRRPRRGACSTASSRARSTWPRGSGTRSCRWPTTAR